MPMIKCERCGASSFEGGSDRDEFCPWCKRRKAAGSREEMAENIRRLREAVLMAIGFHAGVSIIKSKEQLQEHLVKAIKETE